MNIARRGPLAWSQHLFWYYNEPTFPREWQTELALRRPLDLPAGTTTADLARALAECVERFEALRTVFRIGDSGEPEQLVLADYETPIVDLEGPGTERFDIRERPAWRCEVRKEGDAVHEASIVANQIDLDGYAIEALRTMIERRLATGADFADVVGTSPLQPLDLAAAEAGSALRRSSARAIEAQQSVRNRIPRNALPTARHGVPGGALKSVLLDPELLSHVHRISRACGASPASIVHAMTVTVMAAWTGRDRIGLTTSTANRWRPGATGYIGRLATEADYIFDVEPTESAATWFKRAHGILMRGYRHAVRDFGACTMEAIRDNIRAGARLGKTLFIEYLQYPPQIARRSEPPPVRTVFTEIGPGSGGHQIRFDITPMDPGIEFVLSADRGVLDPRDAERILNLIANLLQHCVDRLDSTMAELTSMIESRVTESQGWIGDGEARYDSRLISALLAEAPGVTRAELHTGTGTPLKAIVHGESIDPVELHEHMLCLIDRHPAARLPTRYVVDDTRAEAPHRFTPAVDYRPSIEDDPRLRALADAFTACHPAARFDPSLSYAGLGGNYLRIPAMVALMEQAGWIVHPDAFISIASMAALARDLHPVKVPVFQPDSTTLHLG
jgi:hypothetical protein